MTVQAPPAATTGWRRHHAAASAGWSRAELLALAAILGCGALLRLGAVLAIPSPLVSDYADYWSLANNLAAGRGLVTPEGQPTAFFSLGYPIFLAPLLWVAGPSIAAVKAVNLLLGVASILFAYLAARRLFASRLVAALGALLLALYIEAAVYTAYVAKENLMVFLVMLQLVVSAHAAAAGRWRVLNPILFGAATGWLAVTGNAAMALMPGFALLVLLSHGRLGPTLRFGAIAGLVAAICIAPMIWRNHVTFGGYGLNNNGGFNLYIGNNPNATPYFQGITETPIAPRWEALRQELGERGVNQLLGELALRHMQEDPVATLRLAICKAAAFWEPPTHVGEGAGSAMEKLLRRLWLVQYLAIGALSVAGLACLRRQRGPLLALGLMLLGYTAVHMLFYVVYRYRLPVMPLLCLAGSLGAANSVAAVRDGWPRGRLRAR
jgi:4-amino-4-deoxy-L-arabinose transferase-like glycosyltransferase